jgi:flagellar basal-body rod protein FlgC
MIALIPGVRSTVSALEAERMRMEIVSQNIANANTTRGPDGKPYQRQQVVFENVLNNVSGNTEPGVVQISKVVKDTRPLQRIYNPGHPDADKYGMVTIPNVNLQEEMVDMISASRSFEANLAVIKSARSMVMNTLSIGKR